MAKINGGIIGPNNPTGPFSAGGVWRLEDAFNAQKAGTWPLVLGYQIPNSARFNSGSSDSLTRTPASTTNRKTFTISTWFKRSTPTQIQFLFGTSDDNFVGSFFLFELKSTDVLDINNYPVGFRFTTNQVFRDPSAWYHLVFSCDTTQATESNRVKIYLNGNQITSFSTANYPTQNLDTLVNLSTHENSFSGGSFKYNGYLAETYLIDGQQLTPSSFGQTDSATGIWQPKAYTGTFGTNGFYLNFANSADLGNDVSGNNNDFTVNNLTSIDQSYDSPTNNFATMNPLYAWTYNLTLTEGNLSCAGTQNQWQGAIGSIGISKGKWYYEVKFTSATNVGDFYIGFGGLDNFVPGSPAFRNGVAFYNFDGGEVNVADTSNTTVTTADYGTFANGDIMGVALDYDNELITIYKNGSAIVTNFDYGAATYPSTLINGKTNL